MMIHFRKLAGILLVLVMVVSLTACGKKGDVSETLSADTLGGKYVNAFIGSQGADAHAVVKELIDKNYMDNLVDMEVEPGYLNGFKEEIKGFTKGVQFSPMIGAIPFVAYVMETEDPDGLIKEMTDNADPGWNICTQADEMQSAKKDQLVFFIMCSNEEW